MEDRLPRKRARLASGEHESRKLQKTGDIITSTKSQASTDRNIFPSSHGTTGMLQVAIDDSEIGPIPGSNLRREPGHEKSRMLGYNAPDGLHIGHGNVSERPLEGMRPRRTAATSRKMPEHSAHVSLNSEEEETSSGDNEGSDYANTIRQHTQRKRSKSADDGPAPKGRTIAQGKTRSGVTTKEITARRHDGIGSRRPLRMRQSLSNLRSSTDPESDPNDEDFDPNTDLDPDTESEEEERTQQAQRESGKFQQRQTALKAADSDIADFFREIRLSHYVQNPPPPLPDKLSIGDNSSTPKNQQRKGRKASRKLYASTVTRANLQEYGEWEFAGFDEIGKLKQAVSYSATTDIYQPLDLTGSEIPWSAKPFADGDLEISSKNEQGKQLKREAKLDRGIRRGRQWAESRINSGTFAPEFPLEWKTEADSVFTPRVETHRPEMPDAFKRRVRKIPSPSIYKSPSPCPSHDFPPRKPNSTSPSHHSETTHESPGTGIGNSLSTSPSHEYTPRARTSELPTSPPELEPKTETRPEFLVAEQFIAEHGLREDVQEDIKRLEEFLNTEQCNFDQELELERRRAKLHQSKRDLCAALERIGAASSFFSFVPKAQIEERDRLEHTGNAAMTENADDLGNTAMERIRRWMLFEGINEDYMERLDAETAKGNITRTKRKAGQIKKIPSEIEIERRVGSLFVGLFRFAELREMGNEKLRYPKDLRLFGTSPRPDYAARAAGKEWSQWPVDLLPTLASGDFKRFDARPEDYEAQIAMNSQFILKLCIIMHLDTRKTANAPLPSWMWVYSWVCTNRGFTIYAHYPSIKLLDNGENWSWKFISFKITERFKEVWTYGDSDPVDRMQAIAAFDMIASHTDSVLEQFRRWAQSRGRYQPGGIMNKLIARAHLERGNEDWLSRTLMTVNPETVSD